MLYRYIEPTRDCNGNPINFTDPTGHKAKKVFKPRKDPKKGSPNRQPGGDRERNVGHPNGEEHSRVPKGSGRGAPRRLTPPIQKPVRRPDPQPAPRPDYKINYGNSKAYNNRMKNAGKAVATAGAGYIIYRGVRMIPSLYPGLWWTIPGNLAMP